MAGCRSARRRGASGFEGLFEKSGEAGSAPRTASSAGRASLGDSSPIPVRREETESQGEAGPTRSAVRAAEAAASLRTKPRAELGGLQSPRRPQADGHGGSEVRREQEQG